ncbi:RNA polymerase sigma factor [Cohnella sp. GCM10027633]|uniref:RNA polymerase sigma factor n=1 Tax=unclassified Cohnella TaxID=2636738 RepID=UPI0036409858
MQIHSTYDNLLKPHMDDLRKYCAYLTKSRWDAEDLVQETLVRTLQYFKNVEPRQGTKPFLFRVARNLWIDQIRAKRRRGENAVFDNDDALACTDSDYGEVRSLIEWMANKFPRRNIQFWLLANYFGYAMHEISELTECSVSNVKTVLYRTRHRLHSLKRNPGFPRANQAHSEDVERWSRAILTDNPKSLWGGSERRTS